MTGTAIYCGTCGAKLRDGVCSACGDGGFEPRVLSIDEVCHEPLGAFAKFIREREEAERIEAELLKMARHIVGLSELPEDHGK